MKFGLIYTGSDDGLVYVTKDGGNNWQLISKSLPQNLWVSRVVASSHDTGTVYVTLNGYRWDDFAPYLFRSTNYGKTWEKLGENLPNESINVVREDPINKDVLYVGTDHGVYVSLDAGKMFMPLFKGMPQVPVHDLAVQSRDKNLVVGTHGRSIYVTDIKYIEKLTPKLLAENVHLFPVEDINFDKNWGNKGYTWGEPDVPSLQFVYFTGSNGKAVITILTDDDKELKTISISSDHGLNFFDYDLTIDSGKVNFYKEFINSKIKNDNKYEFKKTDTGNTYLHPGKYKVVIEIDGKKVTQEFEVKGGNKREHVNEEMGP